MRVPGAVVIGGYINGFGLVRSLSARNIPVAVITTQPYDVAHRSRHVRARASSLEAEEQPELLVDLLERRAREWPNWALFPTTDGTLTALAQHHDRLSSKYRVIAPSWEATNCLLNKERMREEAQAVGIDVPHCYGDAVTSNAAAEKLRFPLLVKPVISHHFTEHFGCKLFVARNREELDRCIARVEEAKIACRILDFIPGNDDQLYNHCLYIDRNGEPSRGLTVRKIRQSPPFFGVARVAEIAADQPGLREATIELLRRIGFRGMAAAEFKRDARDGTFRFIEVNGRSVIYNGLLRRAGLDLAGMAWSDCVCGQSEPARPNGWPGVWINLHADILYSALYRHRRISFKEFLYPYRRPIVEALWSARDPAPFLLQWAKTIQDGVSALWHGRFLHQLAEKTKPLDATA